MTRNLIFVSHCDFHGNSAMHLFSIANVLTDLGHSCAVCVPDRPETVLDHGQPRFQVLDYEKAVLHGVSFPNGRGADLVHAWTPREHVRKTMMSLVRRYKAFYFVHLEDNEIAILLDELPRWSLRELERLPSRALDTIVLSHRTHPRHWRRFLAEASGITALIDRLLEFKPSHVPGMVFFPGYDGEFAKIDGRDEELRTTLGITPDELLVAYTGNVHNSNWREVRSLVLAIALVNRRGFKAKLVKTGWNYYVLPELSNPEIARYVIDRGFVARCELPRLLSAADVLVQPGQSGEFNDYRFPSKLPEFLVSGRPVILPRSNVGLLLKDGEEALVLERGDSVEIANALQHLATDPELRAGIGRRGRDFALRNLDWAKNAAALPNFYDQCLANARLSASSQISRQQAIPEPVVPKLIAFYLPQFHPIPENDAWWGKGFTEWTNTVGARPNFEGHVQPRLPADLGFYDLRLPEAMDAQMKMARRFGVFGFCFHYYWFNGRRLLERPLDQFVERGHPDFPFCICWANENWTRRWDGQENEILVKQEYEDNFSVKFIKDVIPVLKDPRYIRAAGAPVLLVYRVALLPDPRHTAEIWREECRRAGIPSIHLVAVQSFGIGDPRPFGFDAAVEFPPHTRHFLIDPQTFPGINSTFEGHLEDYQKVVMDQLAKPLPDYTLYRGIMPSWDNTPRRKHLAHILVNSSPDAYQAWLRKITAQAIALAEAQEPLIFVNAWNEWAEGAILEPDVHHGYQFLEATRIGLGEGLADHLRARGVKIDEATAANLLMPGEERVSGSKSLENRYQLPHRMKTIVSDRRHASLAAKPRDPLGLAAPSNATTLEAQEIGRPEQQSRSNGRRSHKTDAWFTDEQLAGLAAKYRGRFKLAPLSYGTVGDFCDSFDHLHPIATANGDLKDNQRPWALKAILSVVPPGGRVLEIGAGEPFIADILDRLGYEVWVVDPYDGTGNGPLEYERFQKECPRVHFVRGYFCEQVVSAPPAGFDCIYSISVLEHVPVKLLEGVFAGLKKYLRPNGWSIHAVDHIHRGSGAVEHCEKLRSIVRGSGLEETTLTRLVERMNEDPETYFLSAESHNRWRGALSYDEFPMRVCVSIQLVSEAASLHRP